METTKPESQAILEFAESHLETKVVEITRGDRKILVIVKPRGTEVQTVKPLLDEYLTAPECRKGTAKLEDLPSFIAHVARFADTDSALFATPDRAAPKIVGVLDYHRAGSEGAPRFGQHRAEYSFPLSDEWKAWAAADGQKMGQKAFAEFIENRIADIAPANDTSDAINDLAAKLRGEIASPGRLLDLSRGLSVNEGAAVKNAMNLSSGESQIAFVTTHTDDDGKPIRVPSLFLIHIPVFRLGAPYEIAVRLRYRVTSGVIVWFFELYRADKVFDAAFTEAAAEAAKQTGLPLFMGSPE